MGDYEDILADTGAPPCNCELKAFSFPSGMRLYVDGEDITYYAFGSETVTPDEFTSQYREIDLSAYVSGPGRHNFTITSDTYGIIDARLELK
jgi:hypothetical protein